MNIITTTDALQAFCSEAAHHPYVTVDTEFLRERTYFAKLCLVQLAMPGHDDSTGVVVDTLAPGLSLDPLYELFRNPDVVKVFHAARQDLEIFFVDGDVLPQPLFDTQVAAMVCGYGEQVGYETLVRKITKSGLDKSSRFTDWSRRPLSDKQLAYALADVTHLRQIYEDLDDRLTKTGRRAWVDEEMSTLMDTSSYVVEPEEAWRRVKTRSNSAVFLAIVRHLAEYRETLAQSRNVPRNRVFKDDVILELAATKPTSLDALQKSRLLLREARKGEMGEGIIRAVKGALAIPAKDLPTPPVQRERRAGLEGLTDLLRVLLKARAEEVGVAQKLVASAADLDLLASGELPPDSPLLGGWRHEVFGADAERLRAGEIALSASGDTVKIVDVAQVKGAA
ncbi:MAG: ribonuclease D [Pseudomonadota bacterium]